MNASSPLRIVSLLASATEILYCLQLGQNVVGVSHECDYPSEVQSKPRVTRSRIDDRQASDAIDRQVHQLQAEGAPLYEMDAPLLRKLQPDMLVTQDHCDVCAVDLDDVRRLVADEPALADTRIVTLNPRSLDNVLTDVVRVGQAAGCEEVARGVHERLRSQVERVERQVAGEPRPRVACIEWIEPLMLAANWTPDLIQLAGGRPGLVTAGQHSDYTSWDQLVAFDPEVVVVAPCGFDLQRTLAEAHLLVQHVDWPRISAVRTGHVFAVDGNAYLNRSGPRLVDTVELLAHLLHPQCVPLTAALRQQRPFAQIIDT